MATKDIFTAIILTIIFVVIINEFMGKEEIKDKKEKGSGASYNKAELDKTIQKLKTIQSTM